MTVLLGLQRIINKKLLGNPSWTYRLCYPSKPVFWEWRIAYGISSKDRYILSVDRLAGFANFSCHPLFLFLTLHSETKQQYLALSHRYPHLFWIISLRLFFHMIVMLFHCTLKVAPGNLALLEWEQICRESAVSFKLERSSKSPVLILPVLCGDNHDKNRKKIRTMRPREQAIFKGRKIEIPQEMWEAESERQGTYRLEGEWNWLR